MDIYIEKEGFYNIEGQLRGLQGSGQPKTCVQSQKIAIFCNFKRGFKCT
jgi:hypothetical protein